jgi:hypothetical protein
MNDRWQCVTNEIHVLGCDKGVDDTPGGIDRLALGQRAKGIDSEPRVIGVKSPERFKNTAGALISAGVEKEKEMLFDFGSKAIGCNGGGFEQSVCVRHVRTFVKPIDKVQKTLRRTIGSPLEVLALLLSRCEFAKALSLLALSVLSCSFLLRIASVDQHQQVGKTDGLAMGTRDAIPIVKING